MAIVLHPKTSRALDGCVAALPQTLIITGPSGVGLAAVATELTNRRNASTRTILPEKDDVVDFDKGIISVAMVRQLYDQTRSKQTKDHVIIIEYAERMGHAAQNAFLKLLEEPNEHTYFILITDAPQSLLSTVRSRAQILQVQPITDEQSQALLDTLHILDAAKRSQVLFIAGGLPAELTRLASDENYFDQQVTTVRAARQLLQGTPYEKLMVIQSVKDNRTDALTLLDVAIKILRRTASQQLQPGLIGQLDSTIETYKRVVANGNIRLCLTQLVI